MKIIIINRQKNIKIGNAFFKKISLYLANKFDSSKNTELNIVFVDREKMSLLNKKYADVEGPTDVLSFSYDDFSISAKDINMPSKEAFTEKYGFFSAGEIIISPEVALDNIKKNPVNAGQENALKKEIVTLIIHGLLHIYGYDHEGREDKIDMLRLQESLLGDVCANFSL